MRRNQIMRLAAIEICNEISGYWAWPLATPDIDSVIDRSMRRVARLVDRDYRAPVKVECCGFTLFRCCCRKKNSRSDAMSNMFNSMGEREKELMEARQLNDYIDTGERRRHRYDEDEDQYMLENDAYEADRRLRRMEDGEDYTEYSGSYSQSRTKSSTRGYRSRRDDPTAYTEEGDSYTRGVAAGQSRVSSRKSRPSIRGGSNPKHAVGETFSVGSLTRSEGTSVGWDEASESQYGH